MKSAASLSLTLIAALVAAPAARAGNPVVIDTTQYMPLGAFNAWEMIDKVLWNGGVDPTVKDESQIIEVSKTAVVDGVPRYSVKTKLFNNVQDLVFQFGVEDGVLYLYGLRVVAGDDLGSDDISIPTIVFDERVPIGDTDTELGTVFGPTDITAKIDISVDVGPKSISGKVFIAGTVTAQWIASAPILTPLGNLGETGDPLAELQINVDFIYSSPDDDINDEVSDEHTTKGVSAVMGPGIGFVQIDGQGQQQKIVNRVILPGELVSNELDADAFPVPPAGDLESFSIDIPTIVTLDGAVSDALDGGFTDGVVTLDDVQLEHNFGGKLVLEAQVHTDTAGPEDLVLTGKATLKPNKLTGLDELKVSLKGTTHKLDAFAKSVSFSCKQVLTEPFDAGALTITYKAGKDPITKLPITGSFDVAITPFVGDHVFVLVNLPVDVPKPKNGFLVVNPLKHSLGAEGVLTLDSASLDGTGMPFPVILKETAVVKEGLPTARSYTMLQTGTTATIFKFKATSTSAEDFALTKFGGKLIGVKILPALPDVVVTAQ